MSRLKRSLVHVFLLVLAVWPAVHIGLVLRYDVNPWKLAGWGMYSAPQLPAYVRVSALTPDEVGLYELRTIQPGLQPAKQAGIELVIELGSNVKLVIELDITNGK